MDKYRMITIFREYGQTNTVLVSRGLFNMRMEKIYKNPTTATRRRLEKLFNNSDRPIRVHFLDYEGVQVSGFFDRKNQ